jgi:hypothetical protein
MRASRDIHGERLARYEEELKGLKSYIQELKDMTARHGTQPEHFEEDLLEAEHNARYYEEEVARIKEEAGGSAGAGGGQGGRDTILPHTARQGIGSLIISSVSFIAGVLIGSSLRSRKGDKAGGE